MRARVSGSAFPTDFLAQPRRHLYPSLSTRRSIRPDHTGTSTPAVTTTKTGVATGLDRSIRRSHAASICRRSSSRRGPAHGPGSHRSYHDLSVIRHTRALIRPMHGGASMERDGSDLGFRMKIVFLHGLGDGDPNHGWLDGLNRASHRLDTAPSTVNRSSPRGMAPIYEPTGPRTGKLPPLTYEPRKKPPPAEILNVGRLFESAPTPHSARCQNVGLTSYPMQVGAAGIRLQPPARSSTLDRVDRYVRDESPR